MKIIADSNVLLRAVLFDDPVQSAKAEQVLREAETIAITLPTLCEFVWVLRQKRKVSNEVISRKIRELMASPRVVCDTHAVNAGLVILEAGGDFADGVIDFEGRRLGGASFATFDQEAATLLSRAGTAATLL